MNAQIMKPEVFESHRCATIIEKNCKLFSHFIEDVSSGANRKKAHIQSSFRLYLSGPHLWKLKF